MRSSTLFNKSELVNKDRESANDKTKVHHGESCPNPRK
jgi:hypothetical protein